MKYKAVIFDLFGTLVENYSYQEYQSVLREIASILLIPFNDYARLWSNTAQKRSVGAIQNIEANLKYICRKMRVRANDAKIKLATQIRFDFIKQTIRPRPEAIEVLSCLKAQGFKIGLISNCSPETPVIWKDTPFVPFFDVVVFSSSAGIKKPDSRIYQLATEQLAANPGDCLYIGDGDSQELTGAAQVGMHPVLIRLDADSTEPHLVHREPWDGSTISSLKDILALVK